MSTVLAITATLLALAALTAWILAIRVSYRIERLRTPDAPRRLLFTNVIASLFRSGASTAEEAPMRKQLRFRLSIAIACFIALGAISFMLPMLASAQPPLPTFPVPEDGPYIPQTFTPPAVTITESQQLSGENPTGTTLFYTRSNQDGTKPERVIVHIVSPTELHVAKMVAPCTDAAYVTATIDRVTHEATQLTGGRLQRNGTQLPQAWLSFDPKTRKISVRIGKPDAPVSETHNAPPAPWRMYDFDLAEFALAGPPPKGSFTFGLALAWPDSAPPLVKILGEVKADLMVTSWMPGDPPWESSDSFTVYTVTGAPFGPGGGGILKLDPKGGHVLSARFDRPNHAGYDDFKLQLDAVHRPDGQLAWNKALADHWKGCPP
ncbi:MAG: hypothetical protein QM773_20040 [Hyphomonadaceae bacterium]